jgi:2-polyprenyl-3-methyl-5-hydroxy-6-metoxy-1,4-benzoquinol methylase
MGQTVLQKKEYIPREWETVPCPFCGSTKYKSYQKFGSRMQYRSVLCKNCKLVYLSPRPKYDQHFIDAAYASYYQYAVNLQMNDETIVKHSSVQLFRMELNYIEHFDKMKTAVLDIGSGMGTFLYAAKPFYKEAVGLDVSEKMAKYVEQQVGIKVFVCQLEDFEYPTKFSLIHMSHVLEHVPNPVEWLQKSKSLLEKNGILVINIPHKFSLDRLFQHFLYRMKIKKQFSSGWNDPYRTPDHLFEPTIPAMKFLLNKTGYKILEYYTYSRKDPASNGSLFSKFYHRFLKKGGNLSFICTPE